MQSTESQDAQNNKNFLRCKKTLAHMKSPQAQAKNKTKKFNYVWILCNRTDFNLLLDKLSQPNMAASSGLSGKMFFPATWNFNILNDIIIAMIYYPFDIIAL